MEESREVGTWKCPRRAVGYRWREPQLQEGQKAMSPWRPKEHRVQRRKSKKWTLYTGLDSKKNPGRFQMPLLGGGVSVHRGPLSPYGKTVSPTNALMPQLSLWRLSLHTVHSLWTPVSLTSILAVETKDTFSPWLPLLLPPGSANSPLWSWAGRAKRVWWAGYYFSRKTVLVQHTFLSDAFPELVRSERACIEGSDTYCQIVS